MPGYFRWARMGVIRSCLQAASAGALAGSIAAGALLWSDCGHIGSLVWHDRSGWVALALLSGGLVAIFTLAACCGAILELGTDAGQGDAVGHRR